MGKIKVFLDDVRKEMNKVTWPTQKQLLDDTIVVVIFSIILGIFIFGVDQLYSTILEVLFK